MEHPTHQEIHQIFFIPTKQELSGLILINYQFILYMALNQHMQETIPMELCYLEIRPGFSAVQELYLIHYNITKNFNLSILEQNIF